MPDANLSHIVFFLDRSGSMEPIRKATVEGFNGFLKSQRSLPGHATVSLVQFSNQVSTTWENLPISEAGLSLEDYRPDGGTALYDAVGLTVDRVGEKLATLPEAQRPGKVIVAILTDGEENSSRRFSAAPVQARIRHQTDVYGWDFLFLGASASWLEQARSLGIDAEGDAICFEATEEGMELVMCEVSETVERRRRW